MSPEGKFSALQASPFFDRLVFSKIKARLGGRVRICISGGAPLAPHVEDFLRVTMCCFVAQGYGLTESCAASFIGSSEAVGPQLPSLAQRCTAILSKSQLSETTMLAAKGVDYQNRGPLLA